MSPAFVAPPANVDNFPAYTFTGALFRVHGAANHPGYFSSTGDGRFDLVGIDEAGTCYLASTPEGTFVGVFGDLRLVPSDLLAAKRISQANVTDKLHLADVTDPQVIGRFGLGQEVSASLDYDPTQAWARALAQAGFDGIWYSARHDPAGTSRSVAVFGRSPLDELRLTWSAPEQIAPDLLDEIARRFGIEVVPTLR
jgi:hypothetical protein